MPLSPSKPRVVVVVDLAFLPDCGKVLRRV